MEYTAEEVQPLEDNTDDSNGSPQSADETNSISTSQGDNNPHSPDSSSTSPEDGIPQSPGSISTSPVESNPQSPVVPVWQPSTPVVAVEPNPKRIALILSGGGARGAFQVGAEKYARDVKGYHWDIIAGVSVGAMNGAMLAMHRYTRLLELWDSISDSQVYTGGFNLISLIKLMFGAKSFYGNEPLQKLMRHEFEAGRIIDDLHVGAVSLITGEYVQFTKESLELSKAILASASIPVVWPPVDVSPDRIAMVDGGVRNLTPVGDVLDQDPDEIVIINCGAEQPIVLPQAPANVLSIGMRTLDIMENEIFVNDMKEFLRINALVKEAEKQGCLLHHPKTGKLLKYYPYQVIEPDGELGGVLDFSQTSIQKTLKAGVRRAREVLGRP
jgi:NTE family protein